MTESIRPNFGDNMTENVLQQQTLTLEHDQKIYIQYIFFTMTNVEFDWTMTTSNIKVE